MRKPWNKYILILAILAPLFVAGFISSFGKHSALVAELRALNKEVKALSSKNAELQAFLKYFSLKANLEREAKTSLNLAKPGEILVIFVSPSPSPSPITETEEGSTFFQKLLRLFKK